MAATVMGQVIRPVASTSTPGSRLAGSEMVSRSDMARWGASRSWVRSSPLLLAIGVPLAVVSDTLGHASSRVTVDVYGHLLAPSRIHAAERCAAPCGATSCPTSTRWLQTGRAPTTTPVNSHAVGRPGLDPGTLLLKCSSERDSVCHILALRFKKAFTVDTTPCQ
jgi:hypothetical protein